MGGNPLTVRLSGSDGSEVCLMNREKHSLSYVLASPARNEVRYIEGTLKSVVAQTILPKKWVVVSDGSTDGTDELVQRYEAEYPFIHYLRTRPRIGRNFACKAEALKLALRWFEGLEYDVIGYLDADVTFEPGYFAAILDRFTVDPHLGVAGGRIFENQGGRIIGQFNASKWNVAGASQNFRRTCHDQIGGYRPLRLGGVDALADIMARMNGWKVCTFPELAVMHHRHLGAAKGPALNSRFCHGRFDYSFGYHPLFEVAKCMARTVERPYVVGSAARFLGYCLAALKQEPLAVPPEVQRFLRREQIQRLFRCVQPD